MLNKTQLIGNLGADPEVRTLDNGKKVASISLATTEIWKDKQSGEKKEETTWHRVTFFSPLAEIVESYLKKGSKIYVEGKLKYKKHETEDKWFTSIVAKELKMLGAKNEGTGNAPEAESFPEADPEDDDLPF